MRAWLRLLIWTLLTLSTLVTTRPGHAAPPHVRRVAIVIGSNAAPPGRSPLKFAHDDARLMADTLRRVGRFAPNDVHLLLDPIPTDIFQKLDAIAIASGAAGQEILFVFYYSGHSDGQAIFPGGQTLLLSELRSRLEAIRARVLVGIMDTCRGGAWTQAKGLAVGPPLDPVDLMTVSSEGTALVSSSSGSENAHEAQAVQGSFFTHHLVAGLLGAADRTGDGAVTLNEAFDYARTLTIRDSARMAPKPQHPSFEFSLRGRQDVVLAQIASAPSALDVHQTEGPLEVIQLSTGVAVAEIAPGPRRIRLALPPGNYLIRKVTGGKALSREVTISAGASTTVAEDQLELAGTERLAMKGAGEDRLAPLSQATSLPRNWWEIRIAAGATSGPAGLWGAGGYGGSASDGPIQREFALQGGITYAITDRLTWGVPVPAFSYRFGDPESLEVIPRLGMTSVGYSSTAGFITTLDGGATLRFWTSPSHSLLTALSGDREFQTESEGSVPKFWNLRASVGTTWTLSGVVSLNPGVGVRVQIGSDGEVPSALLLGSVQSIGYRSLPLVAIHLSPKFALELHAAWSLPMSGAEYSDRYLGGFAWEF